VGYPRSFLTQKNFELAFSRIVKSSHYDYKYYYRHLFQGYYIGLAENLKAIIFDIRSGTYQPTSPTLVFLPKKSGILRPLTLLSFTDLIVYQAIANVVADKMKAVQESHALVNSFGAIYAGSDSQFFFRSWKRGYKKFTTAIESAFNRGNTYVAEFDIVSCYELIDHNLLCAEIEDRVKSPELLNLLKRCLRQWTTNLIGQNLRHGLPQGPEASAFLAECILLNFDKLRFRNVKYLRYIDDIKLMAKDEVPLRRALLTLDLTCKEYGLVPQAQKINLGKVENIEDITKNVPSMLVAEFEKNKKGTQKQLFKMFCASLVKEKSGHAIRDVTKFRFALNRLNPRRDVLERLKGMMNSRPDCSLAFANYLKKFPNDQEAADIILNSIKHDPTYDAVAANFIEAMDVCEPENNHIAYRRVIQTAEKRSIEKSILLRIAILTFRGRRIGPKDAARLIQAEPNPIVKNIVMHRLFGEEASNPYKVSDCFDLFKAGIISGDGDLARCCAFNLIYHSTLMEMEWSIPPEAHASVKLLLIGLGLRKKGVKRQSVLDGFFSTIGLSPGLNWSKALGNSRSDVEHRCLRIQELRLNEPTSLILIMDTFNESLIQCYSQKHHLLVAAYTSAAGRKPNPDYGNWLHNGTFATVMGGNITWFREVHEERKKCDLAHARNKGKRTKTIPYKRADFLFAGGKAAWKALFADWKSIL
jgi:hypothetical protein